MLILKHPKVTNFHVRYNREPKRFNSYKELAEAIINSILFPTVYKRVQGTVRRCNVWVDTEAAKNYYFNGWGEKIICGYDGGIGINSDVIHDYDKKLIKTIINICHEKNINIHYFKRKEFYDLFTGKPSDETSYEETFQKDLIKRFSAHMFKIKEAENIRSQIEESVNFKI